jgi:hypothetical protein
VIRHATARPYRNDDTDWWAVRDLLVRTHDAVGRAWTWDIRRWDGLRFHDEVPVLADRLAAATGCWESDDGRLVAVVHPEGGGDRRTCSSARSRGWSRSCASCGSVSGSPRS